MPGTFVKTDLAAFLNSKELGDVANYNGNTFDVIFLNEYEAANLFGLEIESVSPQLLARDEDIKDISIGAKLIIGKALSAADDSFENNTVYVDTGERFGESEQIEYKVISKQPDGTGLTTLILSKD
jgi:hypothetical protein